jgi:hypothetical protein
MAIAKPSQWKPTRHECSVIATLSILSLMVALDASVVDTSLSVSYRFVCLLNRRGKLMGA